MKSYLIVAKSEDGSAVVSNASKTRYCMVDLGDIDMDNVTWGGTEIMLSALVKGDFEELDIPQILKEEPNLTDPMIVATKGGSNILRRGSHYGVLDANRPLSDVKRWDDTRWFESMLEEGYEELDQPEKYKVK